MAPQQVSRREPLVKTAVDRIEKAITELDTLAGGVMTAYSSVIYSQPTCGGGIREADGIPGSDLGQALTRLADRIEHANLVLQTIIEQADV